MVRQALNYTAHGYCILNLHVVDNYYNNNIINLNLSSLTVRICNRSCLLDIPVDSELFLGLWRLTLFIFIIFIFFIIKLCYFLALNCGEVSFFPRCLHLTTNVIPVFFQYSCLQGSIVAIHWCNTGWNLNW